MSRPLRLQFEGAVYHITARGNARQAIFLDDLDRKRLLDLLSEEVDRLSWRCHAYCLMPNHYHFLVETPLANLVRGMHRMNARYTQWFNRRHDRVGHLFQGRYKSIIVDRESYLLELTRYIVLNPVRARLVDEPSAWRWSSYQATAGLDRRPEWLSVEWLLGQFSRNAAEARRRYAKFVAEGAGGSSPWTHLKGQIWLGCDEFLAEMEEKVERRSSPEVPRTQTQPVRAEPETILGWVSDMFGLPWPEIVTRSCQDAFRTAVYLLRAEARLSLKEVSKLCGITPSRISRIRTALEKSGEGARLRRKFRSVKFKT